MGWTMARQQPKGLINPQGKQIGTVKKHPLSFRALASLAVKALDIHEGHWSIELAFSSTASNVTINNGKEEKPALTTAIVGVDLMRFDKPNNRSIDAAMVNPAPGHKPRQTEAIIETTRNEGGFIQ